MKNSRQERQALEQFTAALQMAQETSDRARMARQRLIDRVRAEPERVLEWLSKLPEGRERSDVILQKLRVLATIAVLEKMLNPDQ